MKMIIIITSLQYHNFFILVKFVKPVIAIFFKGYECHRYFHYVTFEMIFSPLYYFSDVPKPFSPP